MIKELLSNYIDRLRAEPYDALDAQVQQYPELREELAPLANTARAVQRTTDAIPVDTEAQQQSRERIQAEAQSRRDGWLQRWRRRLRRR